MSSLSKLLSIGKSTFVEENTYKYFLLEVHNTAGKALRNQKEKKLFLVGPACALQAMLPCLSCIFIKYLHYAAIPSAMGWGLPWRHTQSKHRDQFGCCPRLKCVPASKRPVVNLQKKRRQSSNWLFADTNWNLWLPYIDCNRYRKKRKIPSSKENGFALQLQLFTTPCATLQ